MPVVLDHTIVPAQDKVGSAQFIARILGLKYQGVSGPFAQVRVDDNLTLDFDDRRPVYHHHYAFYVDDVAFDAILARLKVEGVVYGSEPTATSNMELNHRKGGRGLYFLDANGHSWELLTRR